MCEVAIFPGPGTGSVRSEYSEGPTDRDRGRSTRSKVKTQQKETYLFFVPQLRVHVLYTGNNRYFWDDF